MNYLLNPWLMGKVLKSYIFDLNRLWSIGEKELQKYQEKRIKKIVRFSYEKIPFYRKKYQKVGVHPDDIETIDDLKKLPFVSKDDLRKCSPRDITPSSRNNLIKTSTSGTMGKPVSVYVSMHEIVMGLLGYLRTLKEHGINWRKDRIVLLLDLRRNSAERKYLNEGVVPGFRPFLSFNNIRIYSFKVDSEKLIKELDEFQPDFIGGYTGKLVNLALLKEKGFGENVAPRVMGSSGNTLDKYLRALIEEAFDTRLFEAYGATESGPIAFECRNRKLHLNDDLVYTEFINNGKTVHDEPGNIVVTKLYGDGTPVIRYTGINDVVAPSTDKCSCGLGGGLIKKVYGRDNWYLVFSDGRIMLPSAVSEIFSRVVYEFKTRMIRQFEVNQQTVNKLEVKIVIDKRLSDGVSTADVFSMIKSGFHEKVGSDLDVKIKEVDRIESGRYLVSKVDKDRFDRKTYI
ncbi:MAG TPA: phenylacetate--CoA ligase family protein [Thermoplasmatales archaeon]|nr:phenylacetate--CoA ligase family protein [Thermoplasmatales archaeon]